MVFGRTSDEISAVRCYWTRHGLERAAYMNPLLGGALGSNIAEKKRVQALVWHSHTLSVATPDYPSSWRPRFGSSTQYPSTNKFGGA